jgi:hypothetical protein
VIVLRLDVVLYKHLGMPSVEMLKKLDGSWNLIHSYLKVLTR